MRKLIFLFVLVSYGANCQNHAAIGAKTGMAIWGGFTAFATYKAWTADTYATAWSPVAYIGWGGTVLMFAANAYAEQSAAQMFHVEHLPKLKHVAPAAACFFVAGLFNGEHERRLYHSGQPYGFTRLRYAFVIGGGALSFGDVKVLPIAVKFAVNGLSYLAGNYLMYK